MLTEYHQFFLDFPALFLGTSAVLGLMVGSFLNVVIYRLPVMLSRQWRQECHQYLGLDYPAESAAFNLFFPRSNCAKCNAEIAAYHNIPLLSYLLLKGRCAHCKAPISLRYPMVELLTGLITMLCAITFGLTLMCLWAMLFSWVLIALSFIDLDTQLLPDSLTLGLLWLGLLINTQQVFVSLPEAVFSAAGAYLFLWAMLGLFYLATGKIGMGEGDFKLFAAFGAWFGFTQLPLILLIASFVGAVCGICYLAFFSKDKNTPLPFGPYLCLGGIVSLFWGQAILNWYIGFYS